MTEPRHGDVPEAGERDEVLRAWLVEVDHRVAAPGSQPGLRRRATLPLRAARRFRNLASEIGPSQALVVAAAYAGRRFRWH